MRILSVIAFAAVAWLQLGGAAEPPRPLQPTIQSIFPRGGRQGAHVQISIRGRHLDNASRLDVSGSGVDARILGSTESEIQAKLTISRDATPSRRDLRVFTPQGTFVQVFEVGSLPEEMESEPNDTSRNAQPLNLPVVINGRIPAGDYDHFRFHAGAGQVLLFDLRSSRVGTRFDGVLWILDAAGREVAFDDDSYFDKDPRIVFTAPVAGDYILRVAGFREAGSAASEYRLVAGELPFASHVFPAGGRRGEPVDVTITGVNLDAVNDIWIDGVAATVKVVSKENRLLRALLAIPAESTPGIYALHLRSGHLDMPHTVPFVVSNFREMVVPASSAAATLELRSPVVINGVIAKPKQKDNFWVEVKAGDQLMLQGDAMTLGNFLDPALTVFNEAGEMVVYIDEAAPNGFDKAPTTVDFRLAHTFERAGRYRLEFHDAGLRGHASFVYRLLVGRAEPRFEVYTLTNQVSVVQNQTAVLPVQVRRFGGWDAPVEVWAEGLPGSVESKRVVAEPVNTRFRGTFSEDFFFDGTNVEIPLQAHTESPVGSTPVRVRARGVFRQKALEVDATVHYPWQQTGYLRGPGLDQRMMLTVAPVPLFELEAPGTVKLTPGRTTDVNLTIRWSGEPLRGALKLEALRLPAGVRVEGIEIAPDAKTARISLRAEGAASEPSARISLVGSMPSDKGVYRSAAPDMEVIFPKSDPHTSDGSAK